MMNIADLGVQFANGLAFGFLLFILTAGLQVIFGLMGVVNIAHGSFFMIAGYVGFTTFLLTKSFLLSILTGLMSAAILGLLTELFLLRRLYGRPMAEPILLTFGLSLIFADFGQMVWGGTPTMFPVPKLMAFAVQMLGRPYPVYRLATILIGLLVFFLLWWFQKKTMWGAIVRAGVNDKQMVTGLGINIALVFTSVFVFGALLAGFGGVIGAPLLGLYPGLDSDVQTVALGIIAIGGLGNLQGLLVLSLLIGIADVLGKVLWPNYAILTIWVMIVLILIMKPYGLFGKG
jgi:branched-chain amino acid transport system permease protein